jgi:hypothetical protein
MENASPETDTTVTKVIDRIPRAGMDAQLEQAMKNLIAAALKFRGHLGVTVTRPSLPAQPGFRMVYRFDSHEHLRGARRQLARGVRALRARRDGQVGCAREENKPPSRLNSDMDKWRPIVRATDLILDALFEAGRMEVTVGGRACAPF